MADVSNLKPGMVLSFELQTKQLSSIYTNVTLLSICDASLARLHEDVDAIHANIIATLPTGTPVSCDEYNFLIVRLIDGVVKAVGVPWIKDPIRIIERTDIVVTIKNTDVSDTEVISRALNAYGFSDFEIKIPR